MCVLPTCVGMYIIVICQLLFTTESSIVHSCAGRLPSMLKKPVAPELTNAATSAADDYNVVCNDLIRYIHHNRTRLLLSGDEELMRMFGDSTTASPVPVPGNDSSTDARVPGNDSSSTDAPVPGN